MREVRDLQTKLSSHDDIVIWLAQHYPADEVKSFLAIKGSINKVASSQLDEMNRHHLLTDQLNQEMRRLQASCSHPLCWHDSGGQYTSVTTYCSICGAEL